MKYVAVVFIVVDFFYYSIFVLAATMSIPDSMFRLIQKLEDSFVMAAARDYREWRNRAHIADLVSSEIPLSMKARCLRYKYLQLGSGPALIVAYIKNYFEPYDLSDYLNVHGISSVIKFRSASATLPVGIKFKVREAQLYAKHVSFQDKRRRIAIVYYASECFL
jgi:hypothetical protein